MTCEQYGNLTICRRSADDILQLWCPFCDEVGDFGYMHWWGELWCMKCGETFGPEGKNQWPKGLCHKCGELEPKGRNTCECDKYE